MYDQLSKFVMRIRKRDQYQRYVCCKPYFPLASLSTLANTQVFLAFFGSLSVLPVLVFLYVFVWHATSISPKYCILAGCLYLSPLFSLQLHLGLL